MYSKLANLQYVNLASSVKVYVPSTVDVNQTADNSGMVAYIHTELSKMFGGATAFQAIGGWVANSGELVTEKVTIVQSFCTSEQLDANIESVLKLAHHIKVSMSQEAVSLEVNNELYFI